MCIRDRYMLVEVDNYNGWRARYMNAREIADWKYGPHISTWLTQRGSEGWELIAWTPVESVNRFQAMLKRQTP